MAQIAVIGCGTWGTALARLLCNNGHVVIMWSPFAKEAEALSRTHIQPNLPDVVLPESLTFTADMEEAVRAKDLVVMAVASPFTRSTAVKMAPFVEKGQRVVTVTKGIEDGTLLTQAEILGEIMPDATIGALSGPTHAEEVIIGLPTAIISASIDREMAEYVQSVFMNPVFRVYTSPDVLGVELGGSLKNVIALAAGMADGMGYGDNVKAALITRGIHEIGRLAIRMGAKHQTLQGLSGIGDLIVTCASMHSRNRRAGILIGQGKGMDEAMREVGQVVEGVYSAKAAIALAKKYDVELPITEAVNRILFEGENPGDVVRELMMRDRKSEDALSYEDLPEGWR
ncbi:MAG: NAD(P)H-dependent glycerol-3-phosphate dehydrogenase [Lachnospiraceae bacterium]|nr:NAD(P)H-dependent glycerol-3-phosphate dehydrogenase [Lachnospiraceae bacterium]